MSAVANARRPLLDAALIARVAELLADDPIVVANTRWRSARLSLVEADGPVQTLVVDRGVIGTGDGADAPGLPEVTIAGTAQQWQTILDGQHGGLHRAWRYRGLDFGGDPVAMLDLWKTVWRLGDALVTAAKERSHAV